MKRIVFYISIFFLAGAFYLMNFFEPLRCDDLIYQYFWLNERTADLLVPVDLSNRIDNICEAFRSQQNHYLVMNGRFIVHFLVSCFCGFGGRPLFSAFNVIVYIFFLLGCVKFLNLNSYVKSTTAIAIIWLGLPIQYILWYSVAFAVNYLWVSTAFIYYIIFLRSNLLYKKNYSKLQLAFLFFLSLVIGSLHEGYSLPLSGALLMLFILKRNTLNKAMFVITLGLWIGTALVVFAPGTIGRGSDGITNVNLDDLLLIKLDVIKYSKRFYLFITLLALIYYVNRNRFVGFMKDNLFLFYYVFLDFVFVLAVPHYSQRIEFPLEMISLFLSINLLLNSNLLEKCKVLVCSLSMVALLIHAPLTVYYAKETSEEYYNMLNEYMASPEGKTNYNNIKIPKFFSSYVHRFDSDVERDFVSFVYNKEMYVE